MERALLPIVLGMVLMACGRAEPVSLGGLLQPDEGAIGIRFAAPPLSDAEGKKYIPLGTLLDYRSEGAERSPMTLEIRMAQKGTLQQLRFACRHPLLRIDRPILVNLPPKAAGQVNELTVAWKARDGLLLMWLNEVPLQTITFPVVVETSIWPSADEALIIDTKGAAQIEATRLIRIAKPVVFSGSGNDQLLAEIRP